MEAIVKMQQNNYTAAQSAYEQAIELEPLSAPLRKLVWQFSPRYLDDCEEALVQLTKANEIDPKSIETKIELARVKLYLSQFDDAINILNSIISWAGIGIWSLRKAYDLLLQCFLRRAEYYVSQHDEINALI